MKKLLISSILTFISIVLVAGTNILPPQLVSPENNSVKQMPDITLNWYAVSGIGQVNYLLEVDTEDSFTNPMSYSLSVTSQTMELLKFGQTYYWHVKAMDDNGESDWSETYSFSIFKRLVPWKPNDGDDNLDPTVELKWKTVVGSSQISGFDFIDIMVDTSNFWTTVNQSLTTDDLFGSYFMSEDLGYVCGATGTLLKYDNGTWATETIWYYNGSELSDTTIGHDLLAIGFNDSGLGYIAGKNGTLIQYDGTQWVLQPFSLAGGTGTYTGNLTAVSVIDESNIWLCNDDGGILSNTTGEWVLDNVGSDPYNAVTLLDVNNGWAVGNKGELASYDGTTWTELETLTGDDLFAMDFFSANNGFAVGESGTILHFDGSDWIEVESNTNKDLFFIDMVNEDDVWAGGENGRLAFFNGFDWLEMASGSLVQLNGFNGIDNSNGWMVGANGTIIQRNTNGFNSPAMEVITTAGSNVSRIITELYFGSTYYWKIRARHTADTSAWSSTQYFSTTNQPTLVAPANNASHQMINPLIDWDKITGSFEYIVDLCEDPTFQSGCTFYVDVDTLRAQNLLFGTTYYWRVKALHTQDTTDWSETRSFTTLNQVDLISPTDGSFVPEIFPTMTWETITGVDGFIFEYGSNDSFINAEMVDITAPSSDFKVLFALEQDSTYFWKIKAYRDGDTTLWSQVWSFTIGEDTVGSVHTTFNNQTVNVYPNPVNSDLFIDVNIQQQKNAVVNIMDVLGKSVIRKEFTFEPGLNTRKIETSGLENGLYIVSIQSDEEVYSMKVLINR